jgi:hypothetical protein
VAVREGLAWVRLVLPVRGELLWARPAAVVLERLNCRGIALSMVPLLSH